MSYITLAFYALLPSGQYAAPVEKTLLDWGITSCTREVGNMAQDNLGFDIATAANGPDLFPWGGKVVVWLGRQGVAAAGYNQPSAFSGGKAFFVGYRMKHIRNASGRMQSFQYKFSGPWGFFMEHLVFQKQWPAWASVLNTWIAIDRSQVVLGQSLVPVPVPGTNGAFQTYQLTLAEQVIEIVNFCTAQTAAEHGTAQFQVDSAFSTSNFDGVGGWGGYCPLDTVNDMTCAECVKRTVKIVPQVSMWFDYSTIGPDGVPLPTFHCATRDTLPSVTLPWGNALPGSAYGNYTSKIERRDDIIPPCVDYKYRVTQNVTTPQGNGQIITIYEDLACDAGSYFADIATPADLTLQKYSNYFGAEVATFDFEGGTVTQVQAQITTVPFNLNNLAFWQFLFPDINATSSEPIGAVATYTTTNPATGAVAGQPVSPDVLTALPYVLASGGGQIAPWMRVNNDPNQPVGTAVPITITAQFALLDANPSAELTNAPTKANVKTKSWRGMATNLTSGTYTASSSSGYYDPVPAGLAAFVYSIEKNVQYDGKHGIVEHDPQTGFPTVTDPVGIGVNLNLSGNLLEYLGMNAQVQQASYDLMTGHTEYTFGVAAHLGGTEMIERLRVNRGPRTYYQIGGNLQNAPGSGATQLGSSTAADAPNAQSEIPWFQLFPIDPADWKANKDTYLASAAGPPGALILGSQNDAQEGGTSISPGTTPHFQKIMLPDNSTVDSGPGLNFADGNLSAKPTPIPQSGNFIRPSMAQLNAIVNSAKLAGATVNTGGVLLRAFQTCETPPAGSPAGSVVWRIFDAGPMIVAPPTWTPPW